MSIHSVSALLASLMIEFCGYRVTGCIGAVLMTLGLLTSSMACDVYVLCLTYGVIAAVGDALCLTCAIVIVDHYFERYLALASGLIMCGFAIAQSCLIPLLRWLIDNYC